MAFSVGFNCRIDADPIAVAKYAIALIKKDIPDDELKSTVCGDLSVFLQARMYHH